MISEERVKELYHLAAFQMNMKIKNIIRAGEYTMWDYVGKEIVKKFLFGNHRIYSSDRVLGTWGY